MADSLYRLAPLRPTIFWNTTERVNACETPGETILVALRNELEQRLFEALDRLVLIDPHTHINPLSPSSQTIADLLGYHYYTELAHSAGLARERIEQPGIDPKEKVARLFEGLGPIENTVQWSWMLELCQRLLDFPADRIDRSNWESLYDLAASRMSQPGWEEEVLRRSGLEAVFLTNDFDDPLEGFSTRRYVPCLRTDDLVFHLAKPQVRGRLAKATGIDPGGIREVSDGIGRLFEHFVGKGARACAISLPPDFAPVAVSHASAASAWDRVIRSADQGVAFEELDSSACRTLAYWVFWTLAEHCERYRLPFDLMIGVNRRVYPGGVYQGQDLFDSRVSMIQYAALLNRFPSVQFPISVLASVTNQELVDYAWIFPNVITHGHWWYSNTPSWIARDLATRLEAIPANKQIGYYSDMYKLEFALPKFAMYKRLLARQLAEQFVMDRKWPEERAVALGHQVLRGNVESVFYGER